MTSGFFAKSSVLAGGEGGVLLAGADADGGVLLAGADADGGVLLAGADADGGVLLAGGVLAAGVLVPQAARTIVNAKIITNAKAIFFTLFSPF